MKMRIASLFLATAGLHAIAQPNAGTQMPKGNLPVKMEHVATFKLARLIALLFDVRMLVREKVGRIWLVSPADIERPVLNYPAAMHRERSGMLGIHPSRNFAADQTVQIAYFDPGTMGGISGSSLALAKAGLVLNDTAKPPSASPENLKVIWRGDAPGRGGQFGVAAFAPEGEVWPLEDNSTDACSRSC
jgi:hypothetical protein